MNLFEQTAACFCQIDDRSGKNFVFLDLRGLGKAVAPPDLFQQIIHENANLRRQDVCLWVNQPKRRIRVEPEARQDP